VYRVQVSKPRRSVFAPLICEIYPPPRRKKKVFPRGTFPVHLSDRPRQRCDGARPACSLCAKSRTGAACVYEISSNPISILGETSEPIRISPPSESVSLPDSAILSTPDNKPKSLSVDVRDFEDPFSSDMSTMVREKATIKL